MGRIEINAYAKINLSLDVLGRRSDGYHTVEMLMQQIELHDSVLVRQRRNNLKRVRIALATSKSYLPNDMKNLAYRAAALMAKKYGRRAVPQGCDIRIDIKKRIFLSAGLAGGSSNAAAVILGLNALWRLELDVAQLCAIGAELGSDVPFCIMGQAKANASLGRKLNEDPLASTCALAEGTGTTLTPIRGMDAIVLLSKPPIGVSTKKVYERIDEAVAAAKPIDKIRPNTERLISALAAARTHEAYESMANVLELYTVNRYRRVSRTKETMQAQPGAKKTLMSGSGPTIFSLYEDDEAASRACEALSEINRETCLTRTLP